MRQNGRISVWVYEYFYKNCNFLLAMNEYYIIFNNRNLNLKLVTDQDRWFIHKTCANIYKFLPLYFIFSIKLMIKRMKPKKFRIQMIFVTFPYQKIVEDCSITLFTSEYSAGVQESFLKQLYEKGSNWIFLENNISDLANNQIKQIK